MSDNSNKELLTDKFTRFLAAKGCRKTPERFAILQEVLEMGGHFDAEMLYEKLLQTQYKVVKATVYNNLELLTECGVLRKYNFSGHAEYEIVDTKLQHIHLICRICGKVKEVKDVELMRYLNSKKFSAFTAEMIALNVQGVCNACARKIRKNGETKESAIGNASAKPKSASSSAKNKKK